MSQSKCDCIAQINEQMKNHNTQIDTVLYDIGLNPKFGVRIATTKIASKLRGKPKTLIAAFCPFCGVKSGDSDE